MAEQNLWSWFGKQVHLIPRFLAFLIKACFLSTDTCLSNYWLMSGEQLNLCSVTFLFLVEELLLTSLVRKVYVDELSQLSFV